MNEFLIAAMNYLLAASPVLVLLGYGYWSHWRPLKAQRRRNKDNLAKFHELIELATRDGKARQ
jgi:type II secretory pathway component PulM